jgi:hypothetical protein
VIRGSPPTNLSHPTVIKAFQSFFIFDPCFADLFLEKAVPFDSGLSEPRTSFPVSFDESGSLFPVGLAKPKSLYFSRVRPSFLSFSKTLMKILSNPPPTYDLSFKMLIL